MGLRMCKAQKEIVIGDEEFLPNEIMGCDDSSLYVQALIDNGLLVLLEPRQKGDVIVLCEIAEPGFREASQCGLIGRSCT